MRTLAAAVLALQGAGQTPPPRPPEPFRPVSPALISQADALAVAQASLAACARMGETASVVVTDADGNMRAALSSDGMNPIGLRTMGLKTATVLAFRASTRDLEARLKTDTAFADRYGKDPRYFYHPGALPLYRQGQFVAVLALGGGHDKDEACGLEALKLLPWATVKP